MDDGKIENDIYQSISHWGLFDASVRDGLLRIQRDQHGNHLGTILEAMDDVMPLLVVEYENCGQLIIMGDHATGAVRQRMWFPEVEGVSPPEDEFTSGMQIEGAPANATRH